MGGQVYRPIGIEWFGEGFWKVFDHPATVQQYLGIGSATPDGTAPLNDVVRENNGIYHCHDIESGYTNKAITLDSFTNIKFDIVIASIPQHIEPFKRLIRERNPNAKLIYQVGNNWNITNGSVKNALVSADIPVPDGVNYVKYHQEFNLDIFQPSRPRLSWDITSMVNCFNTADLFAEDWKLFERVEKAMPNWRFRALGGGCRNGSANGSEQIASTIKNSRFMWHTKEAGDGYGHIIHNIYAVGRPPIVKLHQYKGKLGGKLMVDGETCLDIDGLSVDKIVDKILYYNSEERYTQMCNNIVAKFHNVVDFNAEQLAIENFLNMLQ